MLLPQEGCGQQHDEYSKPDTKAKYILQPRADDSSSQQLTDGNANAEPVIGYPNYGYQSVEECHRSVDRYEQPRVSQKSCNSLSYIDPELILRMPPSRSDAYQSLDEGHMPSRAVDHYEQLRVSQKSCSASTYIDPELILSKTPTRPDKDQHYERLHNSRKGTNNYLAVSQMTTSSAMPEKF